MNANTNSTTSSTNPKGSWRPHSWNPFDWLYHFLFGYDFFISYRWSDGRPYAKALYDWLTVLGFDCFLDTNEYAAGYSIKRVGKQSLLKTTKLILVGSPHSVSPDPPRAVDGDAIVRELKIFSETKRDILAINIGCALGCHGGCPHAKKVNVPNRLSPYLKGEQTETDKNVDSLWIAEPLERLGVGPSEIVKEELKKAFNIQKRADKRRRFITWSILISFLIFIGLGGTALAVRVNAIIQSVQSGNLATVSESIRGSLMRPIVECALISRFNGLISEIRQAQAESPRTHEKEEEIDAVSKQCAFVGTALALLDRWGPILPQLNYSPDLRLRTGVLYHFRKSSPDFAGVSRELESRLGQNDRASAGIRQALLLCAADTAPATWQGDRRRMLIGKLDAQFMNDPDPGVHSAIEYVLRRWKEEPHLIELRQRAQPTRGEFWALNQDDVASSSPHWFLTPTGLTMIAIPPGLIEMGRPSWFRLPDDAKCFIKPQTLHSNQWFALAAYETTWGDFEPFLNESGMTLTDERLTGSLSTLKQFDQLKTELGPTTPMMTLKWEAAIHFCNSLNVKSGYPECPLNQQINLDDLLGLRLPTEAEWEYAAAAGTTTPRFFGYSAEALGEFACYSSNAKRYGEFNQPLATTIAGGMPSAWGFFDLYGNVSEMCLNEWRETYTDSRILTLRAGLDIHHADRGGGAGSGENKCFSAFRSRVVGNKGGYNLGIRLAKTMASPRNP